MSRSQRNKNYKKNWRESKQNYQEYDKRIKLPKSKNRKSEFEHYLNEFGGINNKEEKYDEEQ